MREFHDKIAQTSTTIRENEISAFWHHYAPSKTELSISMVTFV